MNKENKIIRTQWPTIFGDPNDDTLWYCIIPEDGSELTDEEIANAIQEYKEANVDARQIAAYRHTLQQEGEYRPSCRNIQNMDHVTATKKYDELLGTKEY